MDQVAEVGRVLKRVAGPCAGVIQIDTREQRPLKFENFPTEVVGLPIGDYGLRGFSDWDNPAFIVERKSLGDLIGSLTTGRPRFTKEVEKMRAFRFRALVVEAVEGEIEFAQYRSSVNPASVLQSLAALQVRTNLHIIWAKDPTGAARVVERLARQFLRGVVKDANRLTGATQKPKPQPTQEPIPEDDIPF